jgi:dGTPase
MEWNKLLNSDRRKAKHKRTTSTGSDASTIPTDSRAEIERDFDRILFLAPTRRLSDKTQVFPLEQNDSVRTRLTHSHEVANIARGIGTRLAFDHTNIFENYSYTTPLQRSIPSLLAAIGLAHDLGNPPFGHQGEHAIQSWFKENQAKIMKDTPPSISQNILLDFLNFDGNSQTIRLLTTLQIINDKFGINLTFASLASLLKYPQSAEYVDQQNQKTFAWVKDEEGREAMHSPHKPTWKKHGFFLSEEEIVKEVWEETGLKEGVRHPLTYIMEACDDIAYSVLDAEDIVKKGLASYPDLINHLKRHQDEDPIIKKLINDLSIKNGPYNNHELSPAELNDICMQMFRVYAIKALVDAVSDAFVENYANIINLDSPTKDLMSLSAGKSLCKVLKRFDEKWGYRNKAVLKLELEGYNHITELMDMLWIGIHGRIDEDHDSYTPFGKYAYEKISENYRRVFEDDSNTMPMIYKEAQLLTDAISGMTDSYLIGLHQELKELYRKKN